MDFLKIISANQEVELKQRTAWRLVRSADDRFKPQPNDDRGREKMDWGVDRMLAIFPKEKREYAEDYVRAAYVTMKTEMKAVNF